MICWHTKSLGIAIISRKKQQSAVIPIPLKKKIYKIINEKERSFTIYESVRIRRKK